MTIIRYNKFEQPELLKQAQNTYPLNIQPGMCCSLPSVAKCVACHQAPKIYVIRSLHSQMDPNGGFKSVSAPNLPLPRVQPSRQSQKLAWSLPSS